MVLNNLKVRELSIPLIYLQISCDNKTQKMKKSLLLIFSISLLSQSCDDRIQVPEEESEREVAQLTEFSILKENNPGFPMDYFGEIGPDTIFLKCPGLESLDSIIPNIVTPTRINTTMTIGKTYFIFT